MSRWALTLHINKLKRFLMGGVAFIFMDIKKTILKALPWACTLFITTNGLCQDIDISSDWKFKMEDSLAWAKPGVNESGWLTMPKLGFIETLGYPDFSGFAWFRKRVVIPSSYKKNAEKFGYINLILGGIDDNDQSFFNGVKVGESGILPPNFVQGYYTFRIYKIDVKQVLWDQENLIAIRLFDHMGDGGFYKGPYLINIPTDEAITATDVALTGYPLPSGYKAYQMKLAPDPNMKEIALKYDGVILNSSLPGREILFVNGKLGGESMISKQHRHFVPYNLLNWSKANELVFYLQEGLPADEIFTGRVNIQNALFTDAIIIKPVASISKLQKGKSTLVRLGVTNSSNVLLEGTLDVNISTDANNIHDQNKKAVNLPKGAKSGYDFLLSPGFVGVYTISYIFTEKTTGQRIIGMIANDIIE